LKREEAVRRRWNVCRRRGLTGRNNQEGETDRQKSQRPTLAPAARDPGRQRPLRSFEPGAETCS